MRFPVSQEKECELIERMERLGVSEDDLLEKFVHASGPGGQNVNKTATSVYLKHLKTGIEVRCQTARSQGLNRYYARKKLIECLEAKIAGEKSAHEQAIFKLRKQKRRRSRRAKEKILAGKHHQAAKKAARVKPDQGE
ncbi:MAG: peptide chain release factor-like protein [Deltaproteobacteria bacterium]|nr:peptide chain release factor-like protein [Deltaproteobacteria bacterium]